MRRTITRDCAIKAAVRIGPLLLCAAGCAADITGEASLPDAKPAHTPDAAIPQPDAPPPDAGPGPPLGSFDLTYYWVSLESDYGGAADTTIYDRSCGGLATVPSAFADSLVLEGTGRLADGRTLNYDGSCPCAFSPCFVVLDAQHPWGTGSGGRALVPFRSIAVDTDVLVIGKHYWIRELAGVLMPGLGFIHDGCVTADDTGGGINGRHVDFFAALREYYLHLDGELGLTHVTLHDGGTLCP